ncbi:AAA-domain-containing protein [Poronia punctata]|nr:AAA-domain-containing protein [Poronia punctata]
MWPSSNLSNFQKTYDQSYLQCSTAVYYESQGDEREAVICWRNALEQIRTGTVIIEKHKNYVPKSETERALLDSLRELKAQCKDRIDLLEALRQSRQDVQSTDAGSNDDRDGQSNIAALQLGTPSKGWIGDGTIPAITYTELSRPPLLRHPSLGSRSSSERAGVGRHPTFDQIEASSSTQPPPTVPSSPMGPEKDALKPLSSDKRTMRTTLRSAKSDRLPKTSRSTPSKINKGPGASKAATLAWSNLSPKRGPDSPTTPQTASPRPSELRPIKGQARHGLATQHGYWDSHTRRLVFPPDQPTMKNTELSLDAPLAGLASSDDTAGGPSSLALGAASSALNALSLQDRAKLSLYSGRDSLQVQAGESERPPASQSSTSPVPFRAGLREETRAWRGSPIEDRTTDSSSSWKTHVRQRDTAQEEEESGLTREDNKGALYHPKGKQRVPPLATELGVRLSKESREGKEGDTSQWGKKKKEILKHLPAGVDESAAKAIFNEIVVEGDKVRWCDVAGLEVAKNALRETVVYPFLRPDLFMGLREPARGMLLFGPPGTGKTMLARAVATESKSTFFSISASSLTSKYLGESEKLVRALFALAKVTAPSIIFVDEIDSLLSHRSGSGDNEATRRIKTEFLIQWSDLQRAAAGREDPTCRRDGDPSRVLVLAATNLPWAIDEAARRRFVRRQYIPLPEPETRATQLKALLSHQKHSLTDADIVTLVDLTDGFSGSDITALAKDAAMGPLRSLGEALLHTTMDEIRPIELQDFRASLGTIRPSVDQEGLMAYEEWARQFGERGG